MQGITPTADAHNALFRALDLVPFDSEARYQLASSFEAHGAIKDAIATIRLAAFTEKDSLTPKEKGQARQGPGALSPCGLHQARDTARDVRSAGEDAGSQSDLIGIAGQGERLLSRLLASVSLRR